MVEAGLKNLTTFGTKTLGMKRLSLIMALIVLGSCAGYRTSYLINTNAVNSPDACEIIGQRQKALDRQAKRDAKRNRKTQSYSYTLPATVQPKLTETTTTIRLEPVMTSANESRDIEEKEFVIEKDVQVLKNPSVQNFSTTIPQSKKEAGNNETPQLITRVFKKFKEDAQSLIILGLAGLAGMGLLGASKKNSQNISRWGMRNPGLARTALVGAQSVATIGGIALGNQLYTEGVMVPELAYYTTLGVFAGAAAFYPNNWFGKSNPTSSYLRLKMHDAALYTTGAMMAVYAGNHYSVTTSPVEKNQMVYSIPLPGVRDSQVSLTKKDFNTYEEPTKQKKQKTRSQQIGATVGVSVGFAFLSVFVAALSCSISCSGNEGAAIALFIGGEGLIIGGLIGIIRSIWDMPKKNKRPVVLTQPST
jgi:hypothetical protein